MSPRRTVTLWPEGSVISAVARGLAGIVARGLLEQRVLELGHRVVRERLHRDSFRREAVNGP